MRRRRLGLAGRQHEQLCVDFLHACTWRGTTGADWGVFFLPACEAQSVPFQQENVTWHMRFHVAIALFFFFSDPLKLKRARPLQKYVPTEIRARTLVRPGTQTERKALLRNQLFGFK